MASSHTNQDDQDENKRDGTLLGQLPYQTDTSCFWFHISFTQV
jgi:hypothetical protein